MSVVPAVFKPYSKYLSVEKSVAKVSEPTATIMRISFSNFAQEAVEEGLCTQEDIDWLENFKAGTREPTDADVDACRAYVDKTFDTLEQQFNEGRIRTVMPQQFILCSVIYSVFSDEESAEREKKCLVVGTKIKKMLEKGAKEGDAPSTKSTLPPGNPYESQGSSLPPGNPYESKPQQVLPPGNPYESKPSTGLPPGSPYEAKPSAGLPPGNPYQMSTIGGGAALPPGNPYENKQSAGLPPGNPYENKSKELPPGNPYESKPAAGLPPGNPYQNGALGGAGGNPPGNPYQMGGGYPTVPPEPTGPPSEISKITETNPYEDVPEEKPTPAAQPTPTPQPEPQVQPTGNCTYDKTAALAFFQANGIKLVTRVPPVSDENKLVIQRYLDYAWSRNKGRDVVQPLTFLNNALQTWKTGKAAK